MCCLAESVAWLGSATSPGVLCLGSAGSLAVPCLGSVCLALTSSNRGKGLPTTTAAAQPPPAAEGGCVVVSKPLPLLDLLEQVKTRQTEPRQGTASEPAEPRQSTPGKVAEPSQATLLFVCSFLCLLIFIIFQDWNMFQPQAQRRIRRISDSDPALCPPPGTAQNQGSRS